MSGQPRSTRTPRLGLSQPDPGGDTDIWGDEINGNMDVLDQALMQAAPMAAPGIVGGALTLDTDTGDVFRVAFTANITAIALANIPAGKVTGIQLELVGDGTPRTVSFGAWTVATGTPVPTSAVGRKDIYAIRSDGTNVLVWLIAQNVPA